RNKCRAAAGLFVLAGRSPYVSAGPVFCVSVARGKSFLEAIFQSAAPSRHGQRIKERRKPRLLGGVTQKRDRGARGDEIVARKSGAIGLRDVALGDAHCFVEIHRSLREKIGRRRRTIDGDGGLRRFAAGFNSSGTQQNFGVEVLAQFVDEFQGIRERLGDVLRENGWLSLRV